MRGYMPCIKYIKTLAYLSYLYNGKNVITDCILLLFNRIYLILKWGGIARKCLKMAFISSKAKFELPLINLNRVTQAL